MSNKKCDRTLCGISNTVIREDLHAELYVQAMWQEFPSSRAYAAYSCISAGFINAADIIGNLLSEHVLQEYKW